MRIVDVYNPGKTTNGSYPLLQIVYANPKCYIYATDKLRLLQESFNNALIENLPNHVLFNNDFLNLKKWFLEMIINPAVFHFNGEKTENVLIRILSCNIFKVSSWNKDLKWKIFSTFLDHYKEMKIAINEAWLNNAKLPF